MGVFWVWFWCAFLVHFRFGLVRKKYAKAFQKLRFTTPGPCPFLSRLCLYFVAAKTKRRAMRPAPFIRAFKVHHEQIPGKTAHSLSSSAYMRICGGKNACPAACLSPGFACRLTKADIPRLPETTPVQRFLRQPVRLSDCCGVCCVNGGYVMLHIPVDCGFAFRPGQSVLQILSVVLKHTGRNTQAPPPPA